MAKAGVAKRESRRMDQITKREISNVSITFSINSLPLGVHCLHVLVSSGDVRDLLGCTMYSD